MTEINMAYLVVSSFCEKNQYGMEFQARLLTLDEAQANAYAEKLKHEQPELEDVEVFAIPMGFGCYISLGGYYE